MQLIEPGSKQIDSIVNSNARINCWEGSVRSGKTIASIIRWLAFVAEAPPGPMLMVGKTRETLKRNILDVIAELLDPADYRLVYGSGEAFIFGRKMLLASANDERSEGKIRGLTLVGAYGDELTLWPESFFTMLLSRLSVAGAKLFLTTNPDAPRHWFKARYLDRSDELDIARFHFTLGDNPALDPTYVANLKREYTGLWHRRYIEGIWAAAEGAIFDMFDIDRHVVRGEFGDGRLPKLTNHAVGIDWGVTNATAFEQVSLAQTNALYFSREYFHDSRKAGRKKTTAEYARDYTVWIKSVRPPPERVAIDPSAEALSLQFYRAGIRRVDDANNTVLAGISVISTLFALDLLKIHESCTELIREIQSYAWSEKDQQKGRDVPMKVDDHSIDAARYGVMAMERYWRRWVKDIDIDRFNDDTDSLDEAA